MVDIAYINKKLSDMINQSLANLHANAMKGIQGSGSLLGALAEIRKGDGSVLSVDVGDYAKDGTTPKISVPIAYDLWYLFNDVNLIHHIDPTTDSEVYVAENLKFLQDKLNGLKPLKAMTKEALVNNGSDSFRGIQGTWANIGAYFIQVMAYEMRQKGLSFAFDSEVPTGTDRAELSGHLVFPVGQLGAMEVVSLFQETELEVAGFTLQNDETPSVIASPEMFPPMEHAGEGWSFGKYLVERGYIVPDDVKSQVELMSTVNITVADYTKDVKPKSWTKWWIKKTDKLPVPGEFVGVLVKPLSCPPHVWWFQETTPLLYAGNWVETQNLTSGVITMVTLEADRTDSGVGDEYWVKINGIEIIAYASDFKLYAVGDRVAVLKRWTTSEKASRTFTWKDQRDGTHPVKNQVSLEFVIMPITFYKGA